MTKSALACVLLLALAACGGSDEPAAPPPVVTPPADTSGLAFRFTPPAGAPAITSVYLAGAFNQWSATVTPMARQPDGSYLGRAPLGDGYHEYKFVINGNWPSDMCHDRTWGDAARNFMIDPLALACVADGNGGQNAVVGVGAALVDLAFVHEPTMPAQLSAAGGRLSVRFTANVGQVTGAVVRFGGDSAVMHRQLGVGLRDMWRGAIPEGTASYSLSVRTAAGTRDFGPFTPPANLFRAVPWVGGSVGYQIFPDRFWNGDPSNDSLALQTDEYGAMPPASRGSAPILTRQWNGPVTEQHCCHQYFGGDLQGIIEKLDHLQSLGVSLVYMNPIFHAGSAHGYDTYDYMRVSPEFGDERVLKALLDAAHARGMKVMWDFVPNHVGVGHAAFQDAVARGTASPTWDWFTFKVPAAQVVIGNSAHYDAWWGFGSLPKLNTTDPEARAHLMDVVRKWTDFGFDGIRVDVPGEVANPTAFFRLFRQTARQSNPEVYLVGEIWQRSPGWLQGDQFDALMNYAIGQDVIERFAKAEIGAGAAAQSMAQLYAEYPEASSSVAFNVISTHDNARLLTKLGGGALGAVPGADALARQRLASAMLYAIPGVPVTWQGDECAMLGNTGGPREENRYPVQWNTCDAAMLAHYRQLGTLRRTVPALSSPVIRMYRAEGSVIAWLRGEPGAGEVLAVFNAGAAAGSVALPAGSWTDLATGQTLSGPGAEVGARGWRWLRRS